MNKDKRNLIAYTLAYSILFSGCGIKFFNSLNKDKNNLNQDDFTTIQTYPNEKTTTVQTEENAITTVPTETSKFETENPTIATIQETEVPTTEVTVPTIIETEPLTLENKILCVTEQTNIYSNNTTLSLKIGKIKINEKALKILSDDNWTLVNHNNTIGYICNDYLKETSEFIETKYKHEVYNDIVLVTTDLNFRKEPSIDGEIITSFIKNTELEVIAKVDNGWLLVRNNGVLGYVNEEYTTSLLNKAKEQYPDLNLESLSFQKIVYPTTTLNMRNGNSTDYEILEYLEKYESSRVIAEYDDWYFVMTNEYNFGFISKKYTQELNGIYVIVDLSRQLLYLYNDNILYYVTPVITGKPSTPSDVGLFKIWHRGTECYITDTAFVNFWMPYNNSMEGLHDAIKWRNDNEYKIRDPQKERKDPINGSNGCINMMYEPAKMVFENTEIGSKVLVHK